MIGATKRVSHTIVLSLAVALFCFGARAHAWEGDVHYGLTKWLAIKAGFTPVDAEQIAKGDLGVDTSWVTDPIVTSMQSCRADDSGANVVHDAHFPSKVPAPEAPPNRRVTPGEVFAAKGATKLTPPTANLAVLGQYLHALQDSWSHQGEPDVPPSCNPQRAWSHAEARGGWSCHLADLTYYYRWQKDVDEMAKATFDVLKAAKGSSAAWTAALAKDVTDFRGRRSKWDKDAWFRMQWGRETWFSNSSEFRALEFLQGLSLPDCQEGTCAPYSIAAFAEYTKRIGRNDKAEGVPDEVFSFVGALLKLVAQELTNEVNARLEPILAEQALRDGLNISGECKGLLSVAVPLMMTTGAMRGGGARQPLALCELALEKRLNGQTLSCFEAIDEIKKALAEVLAGQQRVGPSLKEVQGQDFDYFVGPGPRPDTYVAVARFKHVFTDVLRLRVARVDGQLKITSFGWMPRP